jgi:hypothetical protein
VALDVQPAYDAQEGLPFSFRPTAQGSGPMQWNLTPVPSGATFDRSIPEFRWTPPFGSRGTYPMTLTAGTGPCTAQTQVVVRVGQAPPTLAQDRDGDGVADQADNCPVDTNYGQEDANGDGSGDACDPTPCHADNLRGPPPTTFGVTCTPNACPHLDGYGRAYWVVACGTAQATQGPAAWSDRDGDRVVDAGDNCPFEANAAQADFDQDGVGDACDWDVDGDGAVNLASDPDTFLDNCPQVPNPGQEDADMDGRGDACSQAAEPTQAAAASEPVPRQSPMALAAVALAIAAAAWVARRHT